MKTRMTKLFGVIAVMAIIMLHGFTTRAAAMSEYDYQMEAEANAAVAALFLLSEDFSLRDYNYYALVNEGGTITADETFVAGMEYALITTGDSRTNDVDIQVYDGNWNLVTSDTTTAQDAIVSFYAPYTGTYHILAKNYDSDYGQGTWIYITIGVR